MDAWNLTYESYDPETEALREALCTLGNGYFATRGAAPESDAGDPHYPGTYVAGLYNRLITDINGRPVVNEDLVNVPNWLVLKFRRPGQEWFVLDDAELDQYLLDLDLRRGVLTRSLVYVDPDGGRTRVTQRRIVDMNDPHLAGLQTTFEAENWSGDMEVRSAVDGTVVNAGVARYRKLASNHLEPEETWTDGSDMVAVVARTRQSKVTVAVAARTCILENGGSVDADRTFVDEPGFAAHDFTVRLEQNQPITIDKVIALTTSRDRGIADPLRSAATWAGRAPDFDTMLGAHSQAWDALWRRFRLEAETDIERMRALNLHIFHLLQTVSKHTIDLDVGIPARGWHGEAYRGHIFWDELFIFPFLSLHLPDLTRSLLLYRFRRLPEARWNADLEGLAGALYPWQSGSTGREESQVVHLNPQSGRWVPDNSRLQRHVNLAIAYNVWQYVAFTDDIDFLAFYGAEMLVEISRMLVDLTSYNRSLDRYEILGVMGPDEYHDSYPDRDEPGLDNNTYTNVMTVWTLLRTREALERIPEYRRVELWHKLGLSREELDSWEAITQKMRVVFHDDVLSQFEGYDQLEEFAWLDYQERYGDIQRLDRILEAEGDSTNRYRLSKQADVVMLFYLFSIEELTSLFERLGYEFDEDLVARTVEYYEARTSHGSTLSRIVNSWVLARSDRSRSWDLFTSALMSDIADIQGGTTPEGIHLGAMAGTVDLVQRCYTGIEVRPHGLKIDPSIPPELGRLNCRIRYRRQWIELHLTPTSAEVALEPGAFASPIEMEICGEMYTLEPGSSQVVEIG